MICVVIELMRFSAISMLKLCFGLVSRKMLKNTLKYIKAHTWEDLSVGLRIVKECMFLINTMTTQ